MLGPVLVNLRRSYVHHRPLVGSAAALGHRAMGVGTRAWGCHRSCQGMRAYNKRAERQPRVLGVSLITPHLCFGAVRASGARPIGYEGRC